ncbi:uncharacterized protein BJ212DRAFT_1327438 [Suillus subaureus]|uniref:Uncharacterized protein n=1 Tax=Suillus subaureus TaxID=48587 RepID=A0A9P7EL59_9AGAM|nr:uncharacterized protein BJ212DRAFT_1327438 [Suillus subaureus]KAG1823962.1 hypothetical protein BJ212DRAFT_1327438 [Suillus subaureus]
MHGLKPHPLPPLTSRELHPVPIFLPCYPPTAQPILFPRYSIIMPGNWDGKYIRLERESHITFVFILCIILLPYPQAFTSLLTSIRGGAGNHPFEYYHPTNQKCWATS